MAACTPHAHTKQAAEHMGALAALIYTRQLAQRGIRSRISTGSAVLRSVRNSPPAGSRSSRVGFARAAQCCREVIAHVKITIASRESGLQMGGRCRSVSSPKRRRPLGRILAGCYGARHSEAHAPSRVPLGRDACVGPGRLAGPRPLQNLFLSPLSTIYLLPSPTPLSHPLRGPGG